MVNDPVAVRTVQGEIEEQQVRAFLEVNGIPSVVRGEALRKTHAFILDGLGAVEILVAPEHADEARRLLTLVDQGELTVDPSILS